MILVTVSLFVFIAGYGYYRYYTSRVVSVPITATQVQDFRKFDATSDFWTSPEITIKPNQSIYISSKQPFHVILGDIEAKSTVTNNGVYFYQVLTTIIDFHTSNEDWGITEVTAKDTLQLRLSQEATATTADIIIKVEDRNNDDFVEKTKSDYYWSWAGTLLVTLILFCLVATGAFFGGKELYRRYEIRVAEGKKQAEIEAEQEKIKKKEREEKEAKGKAEELKKKQEKFAQKIADIDPDTLFED